MAVRRSRAASGFVLSLVLLGVARAQGSGSHDHTGPAPHVAVEVLGAVEVRAAGVPATTTSAADAGGAGGAGGATDPVAFGEPTAADASGTEPPVTGPSVTDPSSTEPSPPEPAVGGPSRATPLVQATLARISYAWEDRLRGWVVVFTGPRAGLHGMTYPETRRIEIYVRDDDTPATLARVLAHELGHAVDVTFNDARDRDAWRRAREAGPSVPWWPNESAPDFATLAGDFAEAFAAWQTGVASESTAAGPLTVAQLELLASLAS